VAKHEEKKLGPIIHWETEPKAESPGDGGMKPKQEMNLVMATMAPDSIATALPSRRTHEELNKYGSYHAKVRRYE